MLIKIYEASPNEVFKITSYLPGGLAFTCCSFIGQSSGWEQDKAYYIVQEGDSLWNIAARFRVTIEDLQEANNISNAGQVAIGSRLTFPVDWLK